MTYYERKYIRTIKKELIRLKKVFGQLVLLGFGITTFTPAAYQRPGLERPLKEASSWAEFRA